MHSRSLIARICLISALLMLTACAATGGLPAAGKEALCAVHNSTEMKTLCEQPATTTATK